MTLNGETFRQAMRAWTTGVGVLMSMQDGQYYGVTINSFTSLSLDPPLVTVVLQNDSFIFPFVVNSQAFSMTILSADQKLTADNFSGSLHGEERMASAAAQILPGGLPVLEGGLAWLACRVVHSHPAGLNTLFIAEVVDAEVHSTEDPLVYHNRVYHHLTEK